MNATVTAQYEISVFATTDGDFVYFQTVPTAPEMEDRVTELHKRFPAPLFRVDVRYR